MIPYIRRNKILEILNNNDIVTIDDIQKSIPTVSISTIRRDLKELENEKKVILLTGGAVKLYSSGIDLPISEKVEKSKEQKRMIASIVSELVRDGEIIYLDSGTTCTVIAEELKDRKITIVTSNISITNIAFNNAEVISLGGIINSQIASLYGPITDSNLKLFNFDKAFVGATGIDISMGVSTPSLFEANKKSIVKDIAKKCYVVCDSSKFHQGALINAFDINECTIISDTYDEKIASITNMLVPK